MVHAQTPPMQVAELSRPTPTLQPEARPDEATVEAGVATRIPVLDNDVGVPDASVVPEMRIIKEPFFCGNAWVEGRFVVYQGGNECIGRQVQFGYSVLLQNEWVTGLISVTVKPRAVVCEATDASMELVRIEGGRLEKAAMPPALADVAGLLDEPSITVAPFCLALEPVATDDFNKFLSAIPEAQRSEQFPELYDQGGGGIVVSPGGQNAPAGKISQRMAVAYAKRKSETTGRTVTLPTLGEFIAAAAELQQKRPDARETNVLLVSLRTGNLQWTSTPCGPESFFTVGPNTSTGRLDKLCFGEARRDRTGFRLLIR